MENWGYTIKRLREERGLTQDKLSLRSGLGRGHISRIEKGHYKIPSQRTFELLAKGLGLTIIQLNQEIRGEKSLATETPEQILDRLRLAAPVSVPVYKDFPFHLGSPMDTIEYVYLARVKAVKKNIEAYPVMGMCLEPIIKEGDIIVIDRDGDINSGDIVACLCKSGRMLGRTRMIDGEPWLENGDAMVRLQDCLIKAPVLEVIRRLK